MKVIDLLNKIANGEEVPTFRYLDRTLRYNKEEKWFDDINDISYCRTGFGCGGLNDEVEIIEEDKKIEKLDQTLNRLDISDDYYRYIMENRFKINEIIEVLNERDIQRH